MPAALRLSAAVLLGPAGLARQRPVAAMWLLLAAVLMTALTQVGGLAIWVCGPALLDIDRRLATRPRALRAGAALALVGGVYALASLAAVPIAASLGRVPLPCLAGGDAALAPLTPLTCLLNRHYATPRARAELEQIARAMAADFPGNRLSFLDASFPFLDGFVLPPHLSHDDGRKVDLALLYVDPETGRPLPGRAPSPIGYWGYVQPGPGEPEPCAGTRSWLRWDFDWLQPILPAMNLDRRRMAALLDRLGGSARISRVFIEPHLRLRLGGGPRVRFQGCAAARHDDHIHVEFE